MLTPGCAEEDGELTLLLWAWIAAFAAALARREEELAEAELEPFAAAGVPEVTFRGIFEGVGSVVAGVILDVDEAVELRGRRLYEEGVVTEVLPWLVWAEDAGLPLLLMRDDFLLLFEAGSSVSRQAVLCSGVSAVVAGGETALRLPKDLVDGVAALPLCLALVQGHPSQSVLHPACGKPSSERVVRKCVTWMSV